MFVDAADIYVPGKLFHCLNNFAVETNLLHRSTWVGAVCFGWEWSLVGWSSFSSHINDIWRSQKCQCYFWLVRCFQHCDPPPPTPKPVVILSLQHFQFSYWGVLVLWMFVNVYSTHQTTCRNLLLVWGKPPWFTWKHEEIKTTSLVKFT